MEDFHIVEKAVAEVEQMTDAEVVVVVAERSGQYRDLALGAGATATFLWVIALIVVPFPVPEWAAVISLAIVFGLLSWVFHLRPLMGLLCPPSRRARQVEQAAAAAFVTEGVHATPRRTGVLLYASLLEKRVVVMGDVGVEGAVPGALLQSAPQDVDPTRPAALAARVRALGTVLARALPKRPDDDIDLSNAVRVQA